MRKTEIRFYYSIIVFSLLILYVFSLSGITPSVFWDKIWKDKYESQKLSSLRNGLHKLSPNLYVHSTEELTQVFEAHEFSLEAARRGEGEIPKLYLARLPSDFKIQPRQNRQLAFLQTVLPIIVEVNQGILKLRSQLEGLHGKIKAGDSLSDDENVFLTTLYKDYNVKEENIQKLLQKVDIIPVSLTLAQGILESGWGTSKLAQKSNSLFGHTNGNNTMKKFPTLVETVKYHVQNLNKHGAYTAFRQKREILRRKGHALDAHTLAEGLKPYSERGIAYVRDLRKIMKQYHLYQFDRHITHSILDKREERSA